MCKKMKVLSLIMCVSMLACACGGGQETEKEENESKNTSEVTEEVDERQKCLDEIQPYAYGNVDGLHLEPGTYVSIIGKSASGEFWEAVEEGAKAAASDINNNLGYKGEDKIKVVYSGPSESENVDEQVNILDEEMDRNPAAIGIAIIDAQSCEVQFDIATMNDIPIVAFDSASDYQGIMAKVGTDNKAASRTAASRTAEAMKERGKVIVLAHDSVSETAMERTEAFVEEMQENHPGIAVANTYYLDKLDEKKKAMADEINAGVYTLENGVEEEKVDVDDEETIEAESITDDQVLDYILRKNPEVTAIYATNEDAVIAALNTCDRLKNEDIMITGFDVSKEEVAALKDGRIVGLVKQNPYGIGYATVVAAARSALEMGNEAEVNTGYTWVTSEMANKQEIQY